MGSRERHRRWDIGILVQVNWECYQAQDWQKNHRTLILNFGAGTSWIRILANLLQTLFWSQILLDSLLARWHSKHSWKHCFDGAGWWGVQSSVSLPRCSPVTVDSPRTFKSILTPNVLLKLAFGPGNESEKTLWPGELALRLLNSPKRHSALSSLKRNPSPLLS